MKLYSSILGLPIICGDSGTKIGNIKDILFCNKKGMVFGYIVEEKSFFSSIKYIPLENIIKINETSAITNKQECIKNLKSSEEFCEMINKGIKCGINTFLYTKNDDLLGQIKDIIFDFQNNKIEAYVVSKGYFDDVFSNRLILKDEIKIDEISNKFRVIN